jgi:hypothetical protein
MLTVFTLPNSCLCSRFAGSSRGLRGCRIATVGPLGMVPRSCPRPHRSAPAHCLSPAHRFAPAHCFAPTHCFAPAHCLAQSSQPPPSLAKVLYLHRSERSDHLVDALGDLLLEPLPDPMAREVVAVPTRGVERWLSQRLSHRLGSSNAAGDGVCANIDFPFPAALVAAAIKKQPSAVGYPTTTGIPGHLSARCGPCCNWWTSTLTTS